MTFFLFFSLFFLRFRFLERDLVFTYYLQYLKNSFLCKDKSSSSDIIPEGVLNKWKKRLGLIKQNILFIIFILYLACWATKAQMLWRSCSSTLLEGNMYEWFCILQHASVMNLVLKDFFACTRSGKWLQEPWLAPPPPPLCPGWSWCTTAWETDESYEISPGNKKKTKKKLYKIYE